jgi:ATP-dependent Zn protease
MISQFGLAGNLVYLDDAAAAQDRRITEKVSEVLDACDQRARTMLTDHKIELFALTDALIKRRYLDASEVAEVVATARSGDIVSGNSR